MDKKEIEQLAYDAIDFFRILEEDGLLMIPEEGYHRQVIDEIREDSKKLGVEK